MYKISLNLFERFQLLQRIPQKGSYQAMICNNAVKSLLEVKSEDVDAFKIEEIKDEKNPEQTTGIKWDNTIDTTKEFELNNKSELTVLVNIIKDMDKAEELTNETIPLATKVFDLSKEAGIYDPAAAEEPAPEQK
jgi:hypothetical protein